MAKRFDLRGVRPGPDRVDWQAALKALFAAAYRVPVKQHRRSDSEQSAVEEFSRRMVQVSELFNGPELGLMGVALADDCSGSEFIQPEGNVGWPTSPAQELLNEARESGYWWAFTHPRHLAQTIATFGGQFWWWFR